MLKRAGSITRSNEDRLFHGADFQPKGDMESGDMVLSVRMVLLGQAAVYLPEPVARANLMLPAVSGRNDSILLCLTETKNEMWQLSVGYSRYRHIPQSVSVLVEAAKNYYQRVLGCKE